MPKENGNRDWVEARQRNSHWTVCDLWFSSPQLSGNGKTRQQSSTKLSALRKGTARVIWFSRFSWTCKIHPISSSPACPVISISPSILHQMASSSTSSGPSRHHLLTAEEKTACISLRSAGWKLPKIAAHLGLNYDTIYKFCKRYDTTGSKESAYSTAGNPKYSPQAIRNMIRNTQKDAQSRRTPLKEIGQQNDGMSASTVSRHLKKVGTRSYKATRSTLAISSQQEEEVCFCNAAQRLDSRRLVEGALDRWICSIKTGLQALSLS